MYKTIFLTGANGFIGSAFLKLALENGYRVKALTRKATQQHSKHGLEFIKADLLSDINWDEFLHDVDVIVHTAAEITDVSSMCKLNYEASLQLLFSAINSGVEKWIQLSSVGAFGPIQKGLVDEAWDDSPLGTYEKTKSDFDLKLKEVSARSGLKFCIIRPSNVYGPGMRNHSIQHMLATIKNNLFFFIGPEGASANYVHVQDVVQALDLCVTHPKAANQTYIV